MYMTFGPSIRGIFGEMDSPSPRIDSADIIATVHQIGLRYRFPGEKYSGQIW
jgi:hypothetical protein